MSRALDSRGKSPEIRVLVVADTVVDRKMLSDVATVSGVIQVVATAPTTSIALQKIAQLAPDVVVVDASMIEPSAVETVRRLRTSWPRIPILMACSSTDRDAAFQAIRNGASDYIAKPEPGANADRAKGGIEAKVRGLALAPGRASLAPAALSMLPPMRSTSLPARLSRPPPAPLSGVLPVISALAIGTSTGGPNALAQIFAALPRDLPVPILVVQHMPPVFTRSLAERLTVSTGFDVVEASEGDLIKPGRAYIAPGDFHMTVVRESPLFGGVRIALLQTPPESSCRPAVDVLFRSVAKVYGSGALAAVLTGMGYDGTRGVRDIVAAGGTVIVQDVASSVVGTMPTSAGAAVTVDGVYPLGAIAGELAARVRRRAAAHRPSLRVGGEP